MAVKVSRKGIIEFRLDLENLRGYKKAYGEFLYGNGMLEVAKRLQTRVNHIIHNAYFGRHFRNFQKRKNEPSFTDLMEKVLTQKPMGTKGTYRIVVISDEIRTTDELYSKYPHAEYLEKGKRKWKDKQAFYNIGGFRPLSRDGTLSSNVIRQINRSFSKRNREWSGKIPRKTILVDVTRQRIPKRAFILAANLFWKREARKYAKDQIQNVLIDKGLKTGRRR